MHILCEWLGVHKLLIVIKWRLVVCLLPILLVTGLALNATGASRVPNMADQNIADQDAQARLLPPFFGTIDLKNGIRHTQAESLFATPVSATEPEKFEHARHCLAQAIYFEARSEPIEGWEAVGQVVINRAYDKRYPTRICDVVFQGEYRRHRCQFSFACDGRPDRAYNHAFWRQAHEMAGRLLTESSFSVLAGTATHYHADYVDPHWSNALRPIVKIGRHIFYREAHAHDDEQPYPHRRPNIDS